MGKKGRTESARRICAHVGCSESGCVLKCSRCKSVFYCTKEHQRAHWKEGGHKRYCVPPTPAARAAAPAADTYLGETVGPAASSQPLPPANGNDDPVHP